MTPLDRARELLAELITVSEEIGALKARGQYKGQRKGRDTLLAELVALLGKHIEAGYEISHNVEQIAGKALGYPRYADDAKNFPEAMGDDVCVGEHVPESIVSELASAYLRLKEAQ